MLPTESMRRLTKSRNKVKKTTHVNIIIYEPLKSYQNNIKTLELMVNKANYREAIIIVNNSLSQIGGKYIIHELTTRCIFENISAIFYIYRFGRRKL